MSHSPSKVRRALVGAGTIAVVLGIVYVVLRMGPLAATQVTVQRVERGVLTPSVSGIGTVEARQSWLLGPTQAGRVLKVHVDVGQAVAAGQLLAEMDPVDLDQRVQAQQAALAKARSSLNTTAAQVDDAQARRELANANLRRQRDLARQNFISPSAVEGREQEVKSADAALQGAQANLQAARQEVQRLRAGGAAEALAVKAYRLTRTENLAPIDALARCLGGYQAPVPADVVAFQMHIAIREATDMQFVPEALRHYGEAAS